jgi:putative glutamine amidotransferase
MIRPLIGITCDNKDNRLDTGHYESAIAYSRAIAEAGGLPLILPQEVELASEYVALCAGILFSGGGDIRTEGFGEPMHAKSRPITPLRQAFELALLDALDRARAKPAMGICLGMQVMAVHAGGRLNQFLPDSLGESAAAAHQKNNRHALDLAANDSLLATLAAQSGDPGVVSSHRQAMQDSGGLRVIARAPEGVIQAVDDPSRPFYLGVQWHPERGGDGPFNRSLIARFVEACR